MLKQEIDVDYICILSESIIELLPSPILAIDKHQLLADIIADSNKRLTKVMMEEKMREGPSKNPTPVLTGAPDELNVMFW